MLTVHDITMLLLALGALLLVARAFGEVARRLGQPSIVGEIAAGVLLGPTVLERVLPGVSHALFPESGSVHVALQALVSLSITMFMLVAGMEVNLKMVWKRRTAALAIGLGGAAPAMLAGVALALGAPAFVGMGEGAAPAAFALFLATALGLSGLAVIAKMLMDLQISRTELGATILAAAVVIDVAGCLLFAVVLALSHGGHDAVAAAGEAVRAAGEVAGELASQGAAHGAAADGHGGGSAAHGSLSVWQTMLAAGLFVVGMLTLGRWLLGRAIPWVQAHTAWPGGVLGLALVGCVFSAAFTEWAGVHAIVGAFIFGMVLGDSRHLRHSTRLTLEQFISFIFAPLFFASIGLRVDFAGAFDLVLVLVVLVVAAVFKIGGCLGAARITGSSWRDALAVGLAMNGRGSVDVILGLLALEMGIISDKLFVALVINALVALAVSGALMQKAMGKKREVKFTAYGSAKTFLAEMRATDRGQALDEMARRTAEGAWLDLETVRDAIVARDLLVRSAIGNGVAVAHARLGGLEMPVVGVGFPAEPIEWSAPDGKAVRLIVVLLTPEDEARLHLELLASVARALRDKDTIDTCVKAESWTEFLAAINAGQGEAAERAKSAEKEKASEGE
ncbi:MAG: cation:proton antiporter [Phycisphaerales bacterium]|nr:cation:proton antiporter [Phycisphaerales bacterium]MCB9840493.1 cation:proton antiporter [Phycisphaeraceae bacterium]